MRLGNPLPSPVASVLEASDGLVHADVVEDAADGVVGFFACLSRFPVSLRRLRRLRCPGCLCSQGLLLKIFLPEAVCLDGLAIDGCAKRVHHGFAVWFLLEACFDHVDGCF